MKRGLQIALGLFSLIPLAFAVLGLMQGTGYHVAADEVVAAVDNQYRYMSGVYILVTFLLWYAIPQIEKHGRLIALVCAALVIGAIGRLISHMTIGPGSDEQFAGMIIEFCSPIFLLWQMAVARRAKAA